MIRQKYRALPPMSFGSRGSVLRPAVHELGVQPLCGGEVSVCEL